MLRPEDLLVDMQRPLELLPCPVQILFIKQNHSQVVSADGHHRVLRPVHFLSVLQSSLDLLLRSFEVSFVL
jgi:hypothetical protein